MENTETLLLGSIGTSEYEEVIYDLDGDTVQTALSPVALAHLCEIDEALIVRTPEAGEANDEILAEGFEQADIDHEFAEIDLIEDKSDIDTIIKTIDDQLRDRSATNTSVVLDISHSFRSLPIVFLLSLMQVESLDDSVSLDRIYYSRFAGSRSREEAPILDLTYLRTLIEWYDAFRAAERTGTYRGVETLLDNRRGEFHRDDIDHEQKEEFTAAVGVFGAAQRDIDNGLPLEAGITSDAALEQVSQLDSDGFVGPEGMVIDPLERLLEGFDESQGVSDKTELTLTESELERQATMVSFYLDHDRYRVALECARELLINRFLYDAGITDDWLNQDRRAEIAPPPGNKHESEVPEVQKLLDTIRNARNMIAHAGHKPNKATVNENASTAIETLCENITNDEFWTP